MEIDTIQPMGHLACLKCGMQYDEEDDHECDYSICECKDKTILVKGDSSFIAEEVFCPTHGYQNTCWICNPGICCTELCIRHTFK